MVAWLLLAAASGMEVNLGAQGQMGQLARMHHRQRHQGTAAHRSGQRLPEARHDLPAVPMLVDLESGIYARSPDWVWRYESLQRKAADLSFLQNESLRVGQAYHAAADASDDNSHALYTKYYDLRDELRSKRKEVKKSAHTLLEEIGEADSRPVAAALASVGSLFEHLGGEKSKVFSRTKHQRAGLIDDAGNFGREGMDERSQSRRHASFVDNRSPGGDENAPPDPKDVLSSAEQTQKETTSMITESKGVAEMMSIKQTKEHKLGKQEVIDSLKEASEPKCPHKQACGGCDNPGSGFTCRDPNTNQCAGYTADPQPDQDGKTHPQCAKEWAPCDVPVANPNAPVLVDVVKEEVVGEKKAVPRMAGDLVISIQGWGFSVGDNPMEDSCMIAALLPKKRLVVDNSKDGEMDEASACMAKALQANIELEMARCWGLDDADDADPDRKNYCIMAHVEKPIIKSPPPGAPAGTATADFFLRAEMVNQPYDVEVHYLLCLVRGPTVETAMSASTMLLEDICVKKVLLDSGEGEEVLTKCDHNVGAPVGQGSGALPQVLAMLALLLSA